MLSITPPPPRPSLFPYTTLFRSVPLFNSPRAFGSTLELEEVAVRFEASSPLPSPPEEERVTPPRGMSLRIDRKSTRLNSSHRCISYAVFCLKKKKIKRIRDYITL